MSNSHLQFALILIRARQSNTSPQSINLCRRLLCFVGATLRLRLCSWLWCFCRCQVFTEDWYCALRAESPQSLGISFLAAYEQRLRRLGLNTCVPKVVQMVRVLPTVEAAETAGAGWSWSSAAA